MTHEEAMTLLRDIQGMDASFWEALLAWLGWIGFWVALLGGTAYGMWRYYLQRKTDHHRWEQELGYLEKQTTVDKHTASRIMATYRAIALANFPRDQIVPLEGDAWLAFLQQETGNLHFDWSTHGHSLLQMIYHPNPAPLSPELLPKIRQNIQAWLAKLTHSKVRPTQKGEA